ncbi:hypothetical protein GCM10007874_32180 [Labrys miyagiensis]|uniref:Uncharacterized protein n=1 Tax=Labrys miyagiensis TaxID=346912 RepID=A0ABQ6CIL0_9HYPH|nr:hypothetical protein [Labrys miyagiensis]GLS20201.1 hypothetical protein GCM10007874_32180 [Labrys miyagiensis]
MTDQILVDAEYDLDIPSDLLLQSIEVGVEVQPPDATVAILGWGRDGTLSQVGAFGSREALSLPFIHRHIAIRALSAVHSIIVSLRTYTMKPGEAFTPPGRLIGKFPHSAAPASL